MMALLRIQGAKLCLLVAWLATSRSAPWSYRRELVKARRMVRDAEERWVREARGVEVTP